MGSLLTSLLNSANAMSIMDRQLATVQNNVSNSSTPGYVRQIQTVHALAFNPAAGLAGGVGSGPLINARSEYAEEAVQRQNSMLGAADQRKTDLAQIETLFDISGKTGLPSSLSALFSSFSQLSMNPKDAVSQQDVLDKADALIAKFHETASGLTTAGTDLSQKMDSVIGKINELSGHIASINFAHREDFRSGADAGVDADLYSSLEELSEYVDISVLPDGQGSLNVYLGGQIPLVIGDHSFALARSNGEVLDSQGNQITSKIDNGRLGGLLSEKSEIASYKGGLDELARTLAGEVNTLLTTGLQSNGMPGVPMFDASKGTAADLCLTGITPAQIAAANAQGSNANALALAALSTKPVLGNNTLAGAFGKLGGQVGRDLANAQAEADNRNSLLVQARNLRSQASGVSLDEEAALLLQIQRQYQAVGKVIGVLNDMTDTLLSIVR